MRPTSLLIALALALAWHGPLHAQKAPDFRVVAVDVAEVRSGPSENANFYVTNRLRRGATVEVLEALDHGWLKVRPPEGSFSWINSKFLDHVVPHQPNYVVIVEGATAPVFMGSEVEKGRTIIGARLKRGTQVTCIGKTQTDEEGEWMPIDAPAGEVRYLRAETVTAAGAPPSALAAGPAAPQTTTVRSAPPGGGLAPSGAPSANPRPSLPELWAQAMQAEREGRIADAIPLWYRFGSEAAASDPVRSAAAGKRAAWLQWGHQNYGTSAVASPPVEAGHAVPSVPVSTPGRTYPLAAEPPGRAPVVRLASPVGSVPARAGGVTPAPAPATPAPAPATPATPAPRPTSPYPVYAGLLHRAGHCLAGRLTYRLQMGETSHLYVTPNNGVNLEPYVGRNVELTGPTDYRGDLRAYLMTVTRVQPLP
jgi:SH3-like domain-containing protein